MMAYLRCFEEDGLLVLGLTATPVATWTLGRRRRV
jgi:hypothetical protein